MLNSDTRLVCSSSHTPLPVASLRAGADRILLSQATLPHGAARCIGSKRTSPGVAAPPRRPRARRGLRGARTRAWRRRCARRRARRLLIFARAGMPGASSTSATPSSLHQAQAVHTARGRARSQHSLGPGWPSGTEGDHAVGKATATEPESMRQELCCYATPESLPY